MVKWLHITLLLCIPALPVQALPPFDSPEDSTAQDGTGRVWALPLNSEGELNCWQNGKWTAQAIPGAAGFRPLALTRGSNGFVYVLWQNPSGWGKAAPPCLVTVQRGAGSYLLIRFSGPVVRVPGISGTSAIFAGTAGDVWISGCQPLLWHIERDGSVQTLLLKPEQYDGGKLPDPSVSSQQPLRSVVDALGHRWFWQEPLPPDDPASGLHGVLIWNGATLNYHSALPGVPDLPFSAVMPLDADHLWVATTGSRHSRDPNARQNALYQVDARTLAAVVETPPRQGAFRDITQIFAANGDWYVIENNQAHFASALWRRRAGVWREVVDCLEAPDSDRTPDSRHPWVAEPTGTWLGVSGGAWWLPRGNRPPLWANWRRGVPAGFISGLFPLANGHLLTDGEGGTAEMMPMPQPVRPLPLGLVTGGLGAPAGLGSLLADPRHHLWGVRSFAGAPLALAEWDGRRWQTHVPPSSITGITSLYACDSSGHLWLSTRNWNPPTEPAPDESYAVYNPVRDAWTKYASEEDALAAAAPQPSMAFLTNRNFYYNKPPAFSGDGRVAFLGTSADNPGIDLVVFYDGKTWQEWSAHAISPASSYTNFDSHPDFNSDGHLEVAQSSHYWEWTPKTGWQRTEQRAKNDDYACPLPGAPPGVFISPATEDADTRWVVWHDAVYAAAEGLWVKQTDLSSAGSPFRYGYDIESVLRDPTGRFFFVSIAAGRYDLVVWSPPPVPAPTLSVASASDDSVTVRFRTKLTGTHWFLWRLNGGAWSAPTADAALNLTTLPQGDYRLEVTALDRHLQASAPAAAAFSIRVAPQTQIARWVRALLSGPDAACEEAVAGLLKQPDAALPALKAARPGASESGRWWIDAALQQIALLQQIDPAGFPEEKPN